jgi:transposase
MSKQAYVKAYPQEFRDKVVQLMQVGERSPRQVAEEFGISEDSVRRWVQQAEREQGQRQDGLRHGEREELVRLRRENKRLKQEREILSKAAAWFARETESIP